MQPPRLLPKGEEILNAPDYSGGIAVRRYLYNGSVYVFTVQPEFYRDDTGLDFTGNRIIVMNSPLGTNVITAEPNEGSWKFQNAPTFIPAEILDMVRYNLDEHEL